MFSVSAKPADNIDWLLQYHNPVWEEFEAGNWTKWSSTSPFPFESHHEIKTEANKLDGSKRSVAVVVEEVRSPLLYFIVINL